MKLKVGDQVEVIDEDLKGEVILVEASLVRIISDDGFEYDYAADQLLKKNPDGSIEFQPKQFYFSNDVEPTKEYAIYPIFELKGEKPEIDLHIEELAPRNKFDNLHDILNFQLEFATNVIFSASRKRIRKLVFVHGVGKGKLRKSLRKLLDDRFPSIEYYDGDYRRYGHGATEIIIHNFLLEE